MLQLSSQSYKKKSILISVAGEELFAISRKGK